MISYKGLEEKLRQRGIGRSELTKRLGLSSRTVAKIGRGEKLSRAVMEKIAAFLCCGTAELYREISDNPILQTLREEKEARISGGLYHELQVRMTYHSNHIEGSRLTEEQTRLIFETNTLNVGDGLPVDDVLETVHHFRAVDYVIDCADEPLSEEIIKRLHAILKRDTKDSALDRFAVGGYKRRPNVAGGRETAKPKDVPARMKELLDAYHAKSGVTIEDVVAFHAAFEQIHPFQDGNGRVGRLIALKECLRFRIVPFLIEDGKKAYYYRGLAEWDREKRYLIDTCLDGQDTFGRLLSTFEIKTKQRITKKPGGTNSRPAEPRADRDHDRGSYKNQNETSAAGMRKEILLNDNWYFHKGDIRVDTPLTKEPVYTGSKTERKLAGPASYGYISGNEHLWASGRVLSETWTDVTLPHDYVVDQDAVREGTNQAHGYLRYENAWYRKAFSLSADDADKRVTLRFDGIAGRSTVYLNGCLMYHNFSSYNTFEIDVTDRVFFDRENRLAVYVNTEEYEGWWYQGGGIYRDVWLTVTDPVAIDLYGVYAPYKKINDTDFEIDFETTVLNTDFEDRTIEGTSFLLDPSGREAASAVFGGRVAQRDKAVFTYRAVVRAPRLWELDDPQLYTVRTVLRSRGRQIDEYDTRIGFRTVEFTANDGFYLNGRRTFIKGVCGHQDFSLTGLAVPANIAKYKISLIKEMGANGYRTSHYQQTAAYLDACDELGLLVMDETRWFESTKESLEQLESLVKRDRNRPSVIMWSTGNEEFSHVTENGRRTHRAMAAFIKKLDHTRPVTAAQNLEPDRSTIFDDCDVAGINYNLELFDRVHAAYPDLPLFSSECCAVGSTRDWHIESDEASGRTRDYDAAPPTAWYASRKKTWKHFMERPYIFGAFQWVSIDHRGEATWPALSSRSGAMDMFLSKKAAFYLNRAYWLEEPVVHIVPSWNFGGLEGQEIFVPVYTNCDELELYLNGASLGKKRIEPYEWGEWRVPYQSGELLCVGYKDGKRVCEDRRVTAGAPARFRMRLLNETKANGRDVALFSCECEDRDGNIVPDAAEYVTFSISTDDDPALRESDEFARTGTGDRPVIVGTGSDNTDHHNAKNSSRQMYMGRITVAVKPAKGQKTLILTAHSQNVGYGQITVDFGSGMAAERENDPA